MCNLLQSRLRRIVLAAEVVLVGVVVVGIATAEQSVGGVLDGMHRPNALVSVVCLGDDAPVGLLGELAGRNYSVHVLTPTAESRARVVAALADIPLRHNVMVEHLGLSRLPYWDNLVNALFVDDRRGLKKSGLDMAELTRVVTPGGTIAVNHKGEWLTSVKALPEGMDDWTHPNYDATNNRVSADTRIEPPFSYKWIDGAVSGQRSRGMVSAHGRLFIVSDIEIENHRLEREGSRDKQMDYLTARDAYNGLVLWKTKLAPPRERSFLAWMDGGTIARTTPLVAGSTMVYAVCDDHVEAYDAATGEKRFSCDNAFVPWALLQSGNTLVSAGFDPAQHERGAIEAFDAATGAKRWVVETRVDNIIATPGQVLALVDSVSDDGSDGIMGCDLATGKVLFEVGRKTLGEGNLRLLSCGDGYALINRGFGITALAPNTGDVLWQLDSVPYFWGPVVDGELWIDGASYDVRTGEKTSEGPDLLFAVGVKLTEEQSDFWCILPGVVNNIVLMNRHHRYQRVVDDSVSLYYFRGMRAACGPTMIAADGMLLTPPVNCICSPTHPYGITALASNGGDPTTAEFTAPRPVEQGPAFGTFAPSEAAAGDWPLFRGTVQRSSSSMAPSVYGFKPRWSVQVMADTGGSLLGDSRLSRELLRISPPVAAGNRVVAAVTDAAEVVALDRESGAEAWRFRAGSRVETSPTLVGNACVFGSNDGCVYAVTLDKGELIWRTRLAPRETRMVEHGMLESPWPVYGSVLPYRGRLYASAGRNSEADGGVVIAALDPATGAQEWLRHIDVVQMSKNDLLWVDDGRLAWQRIRLDPLTGEGDLTVGRRVISQDQLRSGMWDSHYLAHPYSRRSGNVYTVDSLRGWLLSWNDEVVLGPKGAILTRGEPLPKEEQPRRRRGPRFDAAVQPTAMVATPNCALLGYTASPGTKPRLVATAYGDGLTRETVLPAGVVHNGIAAVDNGAVVALENGTVMYLDGAPVPAQNEGYVRRINCGGKEYVDSENRTWEADQEYADGEWGHVNGSGYDRTPDYEKIGEYSQRKTVAGPDPYLYMTELNGASEYRLQVPNGAYTVKLHFAETYFAPDMVFPNGDLGYVTRRFTVSINGAPRLVDFCPLREAGQSHVAVVKVLNTEVANGELVIGLNPIEDSTILNGVEVIAGDVEVSMKRVKE